ncbi:hypothetical protein ACJMK2_035891 [Sinanodonta woodiana]|uniref:RING-type domain-containing protein n=1 Tax=Sinanodonta woodiana TaxID=1069815 RepID=A0ABD3WJK3_SINWO
MAFVNRDIQNVLENFNCAIHLSILEDPRKLPCGHTFCKSCILGLISEVEKIGEPVFKCPVCRAMHSIPKGNSFLHRDYPYPTDQFALYQIHSLSQYEQLTLCANHPKKIEEYFCTHHHQKMCADCGFRNHKEEPCKVVPVEEAIPLLKDEVENMTDAVRSLFMTGDKMEEKNIQHALNDVEKAEARFKKFYRGMKRDFRNIKKDILNRTEKLTMEEKDKIFSLSSLLEEAENTVKTEFDNPHNEIYSLVSMYKSLKDSKEEVSALIDKARKRFKNQKDQLTITESKEFISCVDGKWKPFAITEKQSTQSKESPQKSKANGSQKGIRSTKGVNVTGKKKSIDRDKSTAKDKSEHMTPKPGETTTPKKQVFSVSGPLALKLSPVSESINVSREMDHLFDSDNDFMPSSSDEWSDSP